MKKDIESLLEHLENRDTVRATISHWDGSDKIEVDVIIVDHYEFAPDLLEVLSYGWCGGQTRYSDEDCFLCDEEGEYILDKNGNPIENGEYCDSIVIGSYCVVNHGELVFWKLDDTPKGWYERNYFQELKFLF